MSGNVHGGVEEREINLFDLLIELLLQWRKILLFMLVGGLAAGLYSFGRYYYAEKNQTGDLVVEEQEKTDSDEGINSDIQEEFSSNAEPESELLLSEDSFSESQLANIDKALSYKELYEEELARQQQSYLMQMDPSHVQKTELIFLVRIDDMTQARNVQAFYDNLLSSMDFYAYIQEQCNLEDGLEKLFTFSTSGYNPSVDYDLTGKTKSTVGFINIKIKHGNSDICNAIADATIQYIERHQEQFTDIVGHHVELLERFQQEVVDEELAAIQKNNITNLYSLQSTYFGALSALSEEELQYYHFILTGEMPESNREEAEETMVETSEEAEGATAETSEETETDTADSETEQEETESGFSFKTVLLGMILSGFLFVFLFFLSYIMSPKLRDSDNLQELAGISQLGMVKMTKRPQKRFLGVIDQWILSLKYYGKRIFTSKEAIEMAGTAVKIAAKKADLKKIYMIGSNMADVTRQVCEEIKAMLSEEQIDVSVIDNVLYHAEAMERLESAQGIVLVETVNVTLYEELEKELELSERLNVQILGGILVE